jgi:hypothetical protein
VYKKRNLPPWRWKVSGVSGPVLVEPRPKTVKGDFAAKTQVVGRHMLEPRARCEVETNYFFLVVFLVVFFVDFLAAFFAAMALVTSFLCDAM